VLNQVVAVRLREIGLHPTTRLKTYGTIIDKLRRERGMSLGRVQHLAGARVVRPMTLSEQNRICDLINGLWPDAKVVDRRQTPTHGYRAVHIVAQIEGCYVEIQVRTIYQNAWAPFTEMLGDAWGRAIRYGGQLKESSISLGRSDPRERER
jgi:ppGpp synthetase/RelA/SpoT-type nucleotidyltranferase